MTIGSRFELLRRTCWVLVALAAGAATSCSSKAEGVKTYPAKGKLLWKGQPAEGAVVRLFPVGENDPAALTPTGRVGPDGEFTLTTFKANDGAPAGDYHFTFIWPSGRGNPPNALKDRFKGRFSNPEKSTIKLTVKAADTVFDPIDLK
jgi:hypothetical protein